MTKALLLLAPFGLAGCQAEKFTTGDAAAIGNPKGTIPVITAMAR